MIGVKSHIASYLILGKTRIAWRDPSNSIPRCQVPRYEPWSPLGACLPRCHGCLPVSIHRAYLSRAEEWDYARIVVGTGKRLKSRSSSNRPLRDRIGRIERKLAKLMQYET